MGKTILWLILGVFGFIFVLSLVKRSSAYGLAPLGGQQALAGGAVPLPPASQTASNIDAVLSGASATLPSILGAFQNVFGPTNATGVAGSQAGSSASNVADSYTGAGPITMDSENYNVDYSPVVDDTAYSVDDSLEYEDASYA